MTPEQEIKLLKELLYCTKRSCNNCGKVNCENFQRQRIDCCGFWVSYKDYIKQQEEKIESYKNKITQAHTDGYNRGYAKAEEKIADIKANCDLAIEGRDIKIMELEADNRLLEQRGSDILKELLDKNKRCMELEKENAELKADNDARKFAMAMSEKVEKQLREQIEKMKRHCNCKHRDGEGYCEVKRIYLMDLSYDGCDKWELED